MADDKNALNDLLQSIGRRKQKVAPTPATTGPKALSPLDVLTMPPEQRKVINYLSRRKRTRLLDLAKNLRSLSTGDLERILGQLKAAGYVHEALVDGEIYYRVAFGGLTIRSKLVVPATIWSRLNLDTLTFLQQMPMFRDVPQNELEDLAAQMHTRHYQRNEVIVWQGETSDDAYLIKNGVVGISYLSPDRRGSQTLAYLKQGDILGEIGVLENQARSATATALSTVEVLVIKRDLFLRLLAKYDQAALELARMLGRQLVATSARLSQSDLETRLILVFRVAGGSGGTTIASALTSTLARETQHATVYTEYPDPRLLPDYFGFTADHSTYHHAAGYDVYLPQVDPSLPEVVDITLFMDKLLNRYANIIIGLPDEVDEGTAYMLKRANQVVLVAPPDPSAWEHLKRLRVSLKDHLRSEKTSVFTVINRSRAEDRALPAPGPADFDLPFLENLPAETTLSKPLVELTKAIMNRLGRTSEIAVYIPTTIEVNKKTDTSYYVKQTMAFMAEHFGGATSRQAEGVWGSAEAGLVDEQVYIVRSFVMPAEVNVHLDALLQYVADLKQKLRQEAIALEVDRKFMLV